MSIAETVFMVLYYVDQSNASGNVIIDFAEIGYLVSVLAVRKALA